MIAVIPEESFRVFPALSKTVDELSAETRAWMARAPSAFGIVHADPGNAETPRLIEQLADAGAGFLVGGLTSSRHAPYQIAGRVTGGGVSGILFARGRGGDRAKPGLRPGRADPHRHRRGRERHRRPRRAQADRGAEGDLG